jgi:hypothetical protein
LIQKLEKWRRIIEKFYNSVKSINEFNAMRYAKYWVEKQLEPRVDETSVRYEKTDYSYEKRKKFLLISKKIKNHLLRYKFNFLQI